MTCFLLVAVTLGRRDLGDTPEMMGDDDVLAPESISGSGVPDPP